MQIQNHTKSTLKLLLFDSIATKGLYSSTHTTACPPVPKIFWYRLGFFGIASYPS